MAKKPPSPRQRPPKREEQKPPRPPKKGDENPPQPVPGKDFLDQAPPDLRKEIEQLREYEGRILQAMNNPKLNDLFLHNPKAFFAQLKIPLPPGLNRRLKNQPIQHAFLQQRAFRLPTGQTISPKVNIRFTSSKPEDK